jgi:hypothetical protein
MARGGTRAIMPQSFRPLNIEEERTLLVKGEETITPQDAKASNFCVPGVHVHQENTQFSSNQLMECQLQIREVAQKLVSTPLFSFQDLKLSTKKNNCNTKGYPEHYIRSSANP